MSVVVRMEMPQNCWVCPFGSDRFIWDENDGRPHYVMVRFCSRHSGEEFHVLETDTIDRPWFCDSFICSLPEGHGRLVDTRDIDLMMENASSTSDESGLYSLVYRDDLDFDRLPTIVPAEAERSET